MSSRDTQTKQRPFLAWPGWRHIREATVLGLLVAVWFGVIYGGADYLTRFRTLRVRVHFDAELGIPFVPAAVVFYMSIYPLFWLAPFVLRASRELRALAKCMGLVTLIGGIGFLLIPSDLAYSSPSTVPVPWTELFSLADRLNLQHNLVPSLHVALSLLCVDVYSRSGGPVAKGLIWCWGIAIAISTLLTHQHHVIDVVAGAALALVVGRGVYPCWADKVKGPSGEHSTPDE